MTGRIISTRPATMSSPQDGKGAGLSDSSSSAGARKGGMKELPTFLRVDDRDADGEGGRRTLNVPDDGLLTHTSQEQRRVEDKCQALFEDWNREAHPTETLLRRQDHMQYLMSGLRYLPEGYASLDASRPWLVYWMVQSLDLLGLAQLLPQGMPERIAGFLNRCQDPNGGFGGGPGQPAHLAPTFAAVSALVVLAGGPMGEAALKVVNRPKLYDYLLRMKHLSGGFSVTTKGEVDSRSTYCAIAVASLTNLLTPEIVKGTADYVASCQTYEGGIGGEPGNEAHGGYAYCGLATLLILKATHRLNFPRFVRWAVARQMRLEGGFQGRTNKLVDGCYSFWVGALFPLIDYTLRQGTAVTATELKNHTWLFDQMELQKYLLVCCQMHKTGGMRDKPGKYPDHYHTCYCLSGLSVAQHTLAAESKDVLGHPKNLLRPTNPIYNAHPAAVERALAYFGQLPSLSASEAKLEHKKEATATSEGGSGSSSGSGGAGSAGSAGSAGVAGAGAASGTKAAASVAATSPS